MQVSGSGVERPATCSQLWAAHDAAVLHIAGHVGVRGRWRALRLADGNVEPAEIVQDGLAPRIAVLAGCGSAAAMDEEGWGSIAAALLEAGTSVVIATDRSVRDDVALAVIRDFYAQPDWRTPRPPVRRSLPTNGPFLPCELGVRNEHTHRHDSAAPEYHASRRTSAKRTPPAIGVRHAMLARAHTCSEPAAERTVRLRGRRRSSSLDAWCASFMKIAYATAQVAPGVRRVAGLAAAQLPRNCLPIAALSRGS